METIKILWPIITGGLTVPLAQYIKNKMPGDLPIRSTFLTAMLNLAAMAAVWQIFVPEMLFNDLIPLALTAQVVGQFVHAGVKTKKKVNGG